MRRPARGGLRLSAALLAGTGCAQLAGIDETQGLVPPERVSLAITRVSVGASLVRAPLDLAALPLASYLVADPEAADGLTRIPAELVPDSTVWSADIPDGSPPILFELPDFPIPLPRVFEFPNRNLSTLFAVTEHPNPEPAPVDAMLTVSATLPTAYAANEGLSFYSVGTWNTRAFTGVDLPLVGATTFGPVSFLHSTTSQNGGRPHEKITTADAVMLLRHVGSKLTGVLEATPFDQTGTDTIGGTMTAVTDDQALEIQLQPGDVAARYEPARPAVTVASMSWALTAAPGYEMGIPTGPGLLSGTVLAADAGLLTSAYGNPFAAKGWRTVFTWSTTANRSHTPDGQALPVTLSAGLYQRVEPTGAMTLDLPAGLPQLITLGGQPLSTDSLVVPTPTTAITASFITAISSNTLYQLVLYELVPNTAGTALVQTYVMSWTGVTPEFTIPPELFVAGHYYSLRAITNQGGYPSIGDGDLTVRSLPLAVGYLDSGVFTVTP